MMEKWDLRKWLAATFGLQLTYFKNVYLEVLLIDLVAVVGTAGPTSGEDSDGLSDVSDGITDISVVLDLKKIFKYYNWK